MYRELLSNFGEKVRATLSCLTPLHLYFQYSTSKKNCLHGALTDASALAKCTSKCRIEQGELM